MNKDWQQQAVTLHNTGLMSWRDISKVLDVPRSTISDYLRKYVEVLKPVPPTPEGGSVHMYIPDSQVKKGVPLDYLHWIGSYIARKKPDVIIHGGDFADMPSLSVYDKGNRKAEGKRVHLDIEASIEGMKILLAPMRELQAQQLAAGEPVYNPRMVLTVGNHEDRIDRHVNANPELHGFLSIDSLQYKEFGWEVIPFLTPVMIDGIAYCHYFPNVMTGKALTGNALNMLKTIGTSFTQGHRQTLDVATRFLPASGSQQWGIIAGAAYTHDEDYKGVMGNHHWRGVIIKHNVKDGSYDPLFISLDWLKKEYGG